MEFRPENCRVLATRGNATSLEFFDCLFADDDGDSFVQALRARPEAAGPARLEFLFSFPETLIYDWGQYSSLDLSFGVITFTVAQGGALALAQIRKLEFCNGQFEDGGQAFVDSVRAGRGPKGLILDYGRPNHPPFDTAQRCLSFISALQSNQHLEILELKCYPGHSVICAEALAGALRQNTTLIHLGFTFPEVVDGDSWRSIFDAITDHPALCILKLGYLARGQPGEDLTHTLVAMTRKNNILEAIQYDADVNRFLINGGVFHRWVVPKLECNKMQKRFRWHPKHTSTV